jgi:hypothetical protein
MQDSGFRISWYFVFSVLFVASPFAGLGHRDRKDFRFSSALSAFFVAKEHRCVSTTPPRMHVFRVGIDTNFIEAHWSETCSMAGRDALCAGRFGGGGRRQLQADFVFEDHSIC